MPETRLPHDPPPPVAVDLVHVLRVGIAVWAGALVVTVALALAGAGSGWLPVHVCVAGAALGVAGLPLARRRSRG